MWPGTSAGAFAIVGAAAFLAASMQMPMTALVLMVEFTQVGHDMLIPMLLGIAGSVATFRLVTQAIVRAAVKGEPRGIQPSALPNAQRPAALASVAVRERA